MKLELKPEILEVVKREGGSVTNAGMSRDGQISWVFTAGLLEVTLTSTNEILATWRFGKIIRDANTTITCVTDLMFAGEYVLVVATSSFTNQGTLNIFSVGLRKVIRAIEIPQRVTALDVIFTNVAEDVPDWILSKHLQFFSGLAAVGTEAGYIYLVDLCLDELTVSHSTEAAPKKLTVISPSIVDPKAKREQAKLYDRHLAMLLDDQCHRQGNFYYRRQDDTVQKVLEEDTVTVTSIKYLSQAGTLAVGFNFGSFQLWRLYNPVLDYSSRFSPDNVTVSHFVVQEPENDPRNFVYLWVGHDDSSGDSVSSICLYQLCFARKNIYPSFGMYYDELESVCARLDHKLTLEPYSSDTKSTRSSSIVNCYTIVNPYFTPASQLSDSMEEGLHSNDFSLGMFVWRAEGKRAGGATKYWMCVFDLNRWYHAQMPHTLRCHGNSLQVCSYWIAYDMDEVVSLASSSASLLGVGLSGDKVLRFINNSPLAPEEHSYPSALQLTSVQITTSESCIRARCDGWQGQLLCQFAQNGAQILVQPADFYHQCHRARLLPQNYEELKLSSTEYQRTVLLNMALEQGITSTLVPQCIQQWADGEFAEEGCCLSFLLRWAWDRVVSIKKTWDATCEMLYDWSGHYLDSRTDWQLESLTESLSNLKQIFSALIAQSSPITEKGEEEMELRQDVVNILLLQYNIVRWCVSFNLLPEIGESNEPHLGLFRYPISSLRETYTKKRAELSHKKGIIKGCSLLLIDEFLDCQAPDIKKMWKTLGGNGLYPPPSVQAVVNMYLIEEVSTEVKHAVTLYLLQDMAALAKSEAGEAVIASFIQRFMLSPGLVHQIQGLWFIDHMDFEEGVRHLVNPNIHEDLGGGWKHVAVVNTLLAQSEGKAATRYLHTKGVLGGSPQEQQLYISVLLNNRQVSQALEYMRSSQDENSVRLLDHLIDECRKNKLLGHLLQLSLTDQEEVHLEQYLRGRAEPHALEPLLLYYLHHSRFLQAFQLNEDMKKIDRLETGLVAQERAATRNCLMEAYLRALPDVTCKLLMEKQRGGPATAKRIEVQRPKPLSTKVHKADHVAMSRSNFVMAVLEKVTEARNVVAVDGSDLAADHIPGEDRESRSNVPFLGTPRATKHTMYSRASEVIYPDMKQSPMATNPLSTAKRRALLEAKDGELNGNISLRQLTDECLQLLQTPIRKHKKRSVSPRLTSTTSQIKTPQSILKVQRLNKTVLSSSKDKPSARRSNGRRSVKQGYSPGSSLQTSPRSSPPVEKFAVATPIAATADSTAVKHLRFAGLSPSPTPSPTGAPDFLSLDKSQESADMEDTTSWQQNARRTKAVHSATELSEQFNITDSSFIHESVPLYSAKEALSEKRGSDTPIKEVLRLDGEQQLYPEGSTERYSDELTNLSRPDLQSHWKQGQLPHQAESSSVSRPVRSSHVSSVNVISASAPSEEDPTDVQDQGLRGSESYVAQVDKQNLSSQSSITSSYSESVVKTTTRYVQLSVDPSESASRLLDASNALMRPSLRGSLSPLLVSSGHNLRAHKSASTSPRSLKSDTDASVAFSRRNDSPPLTPPSSKRAKILESRTKEIESFRKNTQVVTSLDSSKVDETRRRKTPERKLNRQDEDEVDEELKRKTPERRSPSRKQQKHDEDEDEKLKRATRERRSPSRKLQKLDEDTTDEELKRKTPERRSPSRKLQKLDEDTVDEELKIKTRERKSPSRKLQKLDEEEVEEASKRNAPERKSPSRKIQKLNEDEVKEDLKRKTPERKSPSRKMQKLEDKSDEGNSKLLPTKSQKKTPDRQSVTRKLLKSDEDNQIMQEEHEDNDLLTHSNEDNTNTSEQDDDDKKIVHGKAAKVDASPERHAVRRSTRLNTPDRVLAEGSALEPLSPARGGRGRATRTPMKVAQIEEERNVEMEEKLSPSGRSTRRKGTTVSAIVKDVAPIHGKNEEQVIDNGSPQEKQNRTQINLEDESEKDIQRLRRTHRQSRTPDRLIATVGPLEPLTPTRKSTRLPIITEKLEAEPFKTPLETSRKAGKERAASKEKDVPENKLELLEASMVPAQQLSHGHGLVEEEPAPTNTEQSRLVKSTGHDESQRAFPARRSKHPELEETTQRSSNRNMINQQIQGADSEEAKADDATTGANRGKSPGKSRRSPARQTRSLARQASNEEMETKEGNNGIYNADEWGEEMPPLRLEEDSEDPENQDVAEIIERQRETPERMLRHHKKGPSSTTSEDPLVASSPGRLTVAAEKFNHNKDLRMTKVRTFVFSPPLSQSGQAGEYKNDPSTTADQQEDPNPVFVFSPPAVAADRNRAGNKQRVKHKSDSGDSEEQGETKKKSKKKRALLSYSPILLSPRSPVSVRRSHRHVLNSQRAVPRSKLSRTSVRRIKPSTWIAPTTSRQ